MSTSLAELFCFAKNNPLICKEILIRCLTRCRLESLLGGGLSVFYSRFSVLTHTSINLIVRFPFRYSVVYLLKG